MNFNYSYQVKLNRDWGFYPSISAGFGVKDYAFDNLLLEDQILIEKVKNSILIDELEIDNYDIVFIAGGWGAPYDLGYSETLGKKISEAYYNSNSIIGGVCHGVLGFINAKDSLGNLIIKNKRNIRMSKRNPVKFINNMT